MNSYNTSNEFAVCELHDNVLQFRLTHNKLNYAAYELLLNAITKAKNDQDVRAVNLVLSAVHALPEELGEMPQRFLARIPAGEHGAAPIVEQAVHSTMFEFKKPLIASMLGRCESQVIDLAAMCDVRIASESMVMQDSRILCGETASTGITYVLPKLIGQSQAMRVLLLGEAIDAQEAHRIHFVHQVASESTCEDESNQLCKKISKMATRSWEIHKLQVQGQLHLDFDSAMVHSLGIRQTHTINDQQEGIQAWRERRDPEFTGT